VLRSQAHAAAHPGANARAHAAAYTGAHASAHAAAYTGAHDNDDHHDPKVDMWRH